MAYGGVPLCMYVCIIIIEGGILVSEVVNAVCVAVVIKGDIYISGVS